MTQSNVTASLNIIARIDKAVELLAARYPNMTLNAAEQPLHELIYAAGLGASEPQLIEKAALDALQSSMVQATLPPWSD